MTARIFRPARTAMQSGKRNTMEWALEFEPEASREIEPLMGYTSSRDMKQQLRLRFDTREEAIAYAERNGIPYVVVDYHEPVRRKASYSDNFRYDRRISWTH
ncbi:MAG: ETC complex I subunit [Flavobacteriaceae bacterium]